LQLELRQQLDLAVDVPSGRGLGARAKSKVTAKFRSAAQGQEQADKWAPMQALVRGWNDADSVYAMLSYEAQIGGTTQQQPPHGGARVLQQEKQEAELRQQQQQQQQQQQGQVPRSEGQGIEATVKALLQQVLEATQDQAPSQQEPAVSQQQQGSRKDDRNNGGGQ
jgi:hypothetical protein